MLQDAELRYSYRCRDVTGAELFPHIAEMVRPIADTPPQ